MRHEVLEDRLADSLETLGSLPGWLTAAIDSDLVGSSLRRHVPEVADRRVTLLSCRAERLRAVGDEWRGRYELTVRDVHGQVRDVVLAGRLWPPGDHGAPTAGDMSCGTGNTSCCTGRFAEDGWQCWLPEVRLQMRAQPTDEALPALAAMVTPHSATRVLESALRQAGHGSATIASCVPHVARYKPGRRCTVVADVTYADQGAPPPPGPLVLKTHADDRGRVAWAVMNALWHRRPSWQHAVTLAEPVAYLEQERILVQAAVPNRCTLKDAILPALLEPSHDRLAPLREHLSRTGRALAAIHTSGVSFPSRATFETELAVLRGQLDQLSRSIPHVQAASGPMLGLLVELSRSEPPDVLVPAHRDFAPGQVLLDGAGLAVVDFDNARMTEPSLDLGRFRAKLHDIGVNALVTGGQPYSAADLDRVLRLTDDLGEHFLASYRECAPFSTARLRLWEGFHHFRLLVYAWMKALDYRVEARQAALRHWLNLQACVSPRPGQC